MQEMTPSEAAHFLFEQYGSEIYRYIRFTVGHESDAEDILQETFLRVVQSWNRFNHISSAKTWLWAIVNNCIRENFRKQRRLKQVVSYDNHFIKSQIVEVNPTLALELEQSLNCLTALQKQVFVERVIHEKSGAETAETLGWSESTVRTTLHRAIKKIQAWFNEGGGIQ